MKLSALKGGVRHLDIILKEEDGFGEGSMWVDYRPGELTFDAIESMVEKSKNPGGEAEAILDMFSGILVDWDLEEDVLDDAGNPTGEVLKIDPTRDGVRRVPLPALGFLFSAIMEDVRPNPPKDEDSKDGSPQEETQEKSLSGTS
jgi:hypothetical protein